MRQIGIVTVSPNWTCSWVSHPQLEPCSSGHHDRDADPWDAWPRVSAQPSGRGEASRSGAGSLAKEGTVEQVALEDGRPLRDLHAVSSPFRDPLARPASLSRPPRSLVSPAVPRAPRVQRRLGTGPSGTRCLSVPAYVRRHTALLVFAERSSHRDSLGEPATRFISWLQKAGEAQEALVDLPMGARSG